MIHYWDKDERYQGILYNEDEKLGECRFVFRWNPFLTNEMEVEIFEGPEVLNSVISSSRSNKDSKLKIISDYFGEINYQFHLRPALSSSYFSGIEGYIRIPVKEFIKTRDFENKEPAKRLSAVINFPLTPTTHNKSKRISHGGYGFFHGNMLEEDKNLVELEKDSLKLETEIGEINISDQFEFKESRKTSEHKEYFSGQLLFKHSFMSWKKDISDIGEVDNSIQAFEKKAEEILALLSLSERNRYDWSHSRYTISGTEKTSYLKFKDKYKKIYLPVEGGFRVNTPMAELHSFLTLALKEFEKRSSHKRNEILKLIENLQIANLAKTLDDSFIRWHSILDFLRNSSGMGGRNPSQQILRTCKKLNIPIHDLVKEEVMDKIESDSDEKFIFTDLRDRYIHSGFDAFEKDFDLTLKQKRIMRAIAERLLLYKMNIDYKNTHLGTDDFI